MSEQPGYGGGNSCQFLQLVGEHLKDRTPVQYFNGMQSFQSLTYIL